MRHQHGSPTRLHTENGLRIKFGRGVEPVPADLSAWLIGGGGLGTSIDPSTDFLTLEADIRKIAATLRRKLRQAEQAVAQVRTEIGDGPHHWWSPSVHCACKQAAARLRASIRLLVRAPLT